MNEALPSHCERIVGNGPGPVVVVLGGTHGDERSGIHVIERLNERVNARDVRGMLYFIIGNPAAVSRQRRSASGARDLNRCFIQSDLDRESRPDDTDDLKRARELAPILSAADYVFDLHSTSNPSPPFIVTKNNTPRIRALLSLLPVRFMLTDPKGILAEDLGQDSPGTTDAYVESHGGSAIGYETGWEKDVSHIQEVTEDVMRLLVHVGAIATSDPVPYPKRNEPQRIYALKNAVRARSDAFTYADGMDRGWRKLASGDLIGTYEDGSEERALTDGMLLFPKSVHKIRTDENLYYIAEEVDTVA